MNDRPLEPGLTLNPLERTPHPRIIQQPLRVISHTRTIGNTTTNAHPPNGGC